ncbi:MAG TPA: flagellar biosynthetic protein FlhB, partial [Gammaproteobacteria bacterium]|nr:flagellar biosynthetic protein FlhB [Gammaproteobacteria bacterium]
MSQETGQERTEQATPKKLRESREKGQVPRSKELNSMALLMASGAGFLLMGESILQGLSDTLKKGLSIQNASEINPDQIVGILGETILDCFFLLTPLFALLVVVALLTPLGLGGWSFSMKSVSFK